MTWACGSASRSGPLMFDDVTAHRRSRMTSDMCGSLLFAHIFEMFISDRVSHLISAQQSHLLVEDKNDHKRSTNKQQLMTATKA